MDNDWVDFKSVKEAVSMETVLGRYGVKVRKVNATYLRGKCPLPTHRSTGSKEKDSFGVQMRKNAWACHSETCVAARQGSKGGNVLDFVAVMESCSVRDAAVKLQSWFMNGHNADKRKESGAAPIPLVSTKSQETTSADTTRQENTPLPFALKAVDCSHPYLKKRGIKMETAETFGVGFFPGNGSMSGRIVFPIANGKGELVAYAGRAIDGSEPEYKFPAGFRKSLELFNLHRAIATGSKCIHLVEGFFDTMKVHQAGFACVVGLAGWCLSDAQLNLVSTHFEEAVIMLDGNDVGRRGSAACAAKLAPVMRVKLVWVPWGKEPDQLSSDEIRALLG